MVRPKTIVVWLVAAMAAVTAEAGKPEPEFRTRIPEITPARWTEKPQPPAPRAR